MTVGVDAESAGDDEAAPILVDSVVAFVDALGISAAASDPLRAPALLQRLRPAVARGRHALDYDGAVRGLQAQWFSDCMCLSMPADTWAFETVGMAAAEIAADFARTGIFLRGALTIGKHCHVDGIDFGAALVEAVKLEEHKAVYPRVVLSPMAKIVAQTAGDACGVPLALDESDGWVFLDFVQLLAGPGLTEFAEALDAAWEQAAGDARIEAKLRWLADYFNARVTGTGQARFATGTRTFKTLTQCRMD